MVHHICQSRGYSAIVFRRYNNEPIGRLDFLIRLFQPGRSVLRVRHEVQWLSQYFERQFTRICLNTCSAPKIMRLKFNWNPIDFFVIDKFMSLLELPNRMGSIPFSSTVACTNFATRSPIRPTLVEPKKMRIFCRDIFNPNN